MADSLRQIGTGEAAALAADALAETVLACHGKRLPREQFVLFELARLAAEVETAVALARKAASGDGRRHELLMPASRVHAAAAARDVVTTGLRLLLGSGRFLDDEIADYRSRARFDDALAASTGELELMNEVAAALEDGFDFTD
jgi:alkylation response protein AidB-like acyl-CoA dehydrogenase